jgi:para-nitrobenzyl esterase
MGETAPLTRTEGGLVRGGNRRRIAAFRAIPYAPSPFGEHRFRAPGSPPRWDGIREATAPGPTAPQAAAPPSAAGLNLAPLLGAWVPGEECLTVNVWTPDLAAGGLPVMVFLHGGAFVAGTGSLGVYDGSSLASLGVVVVTLNYRLGAEGFLPLPGGDTNVGLRDQIAALGWVQANIASFGGDPGRVTVFGESAGAISIACLLASPAAQGLFSRAILQSGSTRVRSAAYGTRLAEGLAFMLGTSADRDGFCAVDPAALVEGQSKLAKEPARIDFSGLPETVETVARALFMPVQDTDILPGPVLGAVAGGSARRISLLAGTNSDEMRLWLVPQGVVAAMSDDQRAQAAAADCPDPARLTAAYRRARPDASPGELYAAMMTDRAFRRPTLQLLDAHAAAGGCCFGYEFAQPSPALHGRLGACHLVELPYVFGNLRADGLAGPGGLIGDSPPQDLADRVQQAWVQFAATGDPGWEPYTLLERPVMRIAEQQWELAADPLADFREAW